MLKRYAQVAEGQRVNDVFDDIRLVSNLGREKVGYPTQKPLALLDRIIQASSKPGDSVLDPFCACATACVSAESLGRQWIGIDLSLVAATLVESRLREHSGIFARRPTTARTSPGAPTWASCRITGRTSTSCSASRKATAPAAG